MNSYNDLTSARATASSLGLARVAAASDAALTAALLKAAMQIDARRYQGRKYDPGQEHAFPRADGSKVIAWDATENVAIVPEPIKVAEVLQAESLLAGNSQSQMQQDIANGIASKSTGSVSVSYRPDAKPQVIAADALQILQTYQLRGGDLL